jgi:hypothetical protein
MLRAPPLIKRTAATKKAFMQTWRGEAAPWWRGRHLFICLSGAVYLLGEGKSILTRLAAYLTN